MSICYHPALFDAVRFERERAGKDLDALRELFVACSVAKPRFGWGLDEDDDESEFISARLDMGPDGKGYGRVGSVVDQVIVGLEQLRRGRSAAEANEGIAILSHVTESGGRLKGVLNPEEPDSIPCETGYLTPTEIHRVMSLLRAVTFAEIPAAERDRKILIGVLAIAEKHKLGICWSMT